MLFRSSMIWFTITDEPVDQTDNGKVSNILVGTADQITDMLKRYKEAGLTMPLLWPPFADVPVSKTLDDLKRLKEEIAVHRAAKREERQVRHLHATGPADGFQHIVRVKLYDPAGRQPAVEGLGDLCRCPDQDVGIPDRGHAILRIGRDIDP